MTGRRLRVPLDDGERVIGQRINNYEIVEQIGEGGMGAVYLGRHPVIDRKVAIKVLRASLADDPGVVNRFFNEAKAASAIRHPNIIEIFDVGLLPDHRTPYLMMEMLDGENLAQRLKRIGCLEPEQAISFALQTASAVAAAHAQGIVHRDLKPENLFLVPRPPGQPGHRTSSDQPIERVKVLDFGIAKLRGNLSGNAPHTQTGALMGTPPYMSPEQCRGINAEVDQRTDVYALGIILYEMLCGTPPFVGEGFGDVLVMHLTKPPDPPRSRNPAVPLPLERVILKALAKTAHERYASMAELAAALEGRDDDANTARDGDAAAIETAPAAPSSVRPSVPGSSADWAVPRATTTFSSTAAEMEAVDPPLQKRRGLVFGGVAAGAVAIAAAVFFGRSAPSGGEPQSAAPSANPALVVSPPAATPHSADAGVPAKPATAAPPPTATPKKSVRKSAPRPPRPRPDDGMGKW